MTSAEESEIGPMFAQRRILLWFCATVLTGVLLSTAYLARRAMAKTSTSAAPVGGAVLPNRHPQRDLQPIALPSQAVPQPAVQVQSTGLVTPLAEIIARSERRTLSDTYLQIAALDRGMSEVLVEVLRRKGFQAEIASGATEDIFRVVVGPVKDAADLARIKAGLQGAGFTSFVRKAPKLVTNQGENATNPATPPSAVIDK